MALRQHQSLKFSYSGGTYSRFGGDYNNNVAVAWQYSWIGLPNKKSRNEVLQFAGMYSALVQRNRETCH